MTAYAIGQLTVHNSDWLEEYGSKIGGVIQRHGGQVIAKAKPEQLEGEATLPDALVTIAFPSMDDARGWYNDPDNQYLVELRQTGANFELLLIDGL